jgi:hypothetical protein
VVWLPTAKGMTVILVDDLDLLFVHVPQTGGTAVRRYLVDNLGGVQVAPTHQVWEQVAPRLPRPDRLRVMTAIRHPMDQTVSSYHKLVTDHHSEFSRGVASQRRLQQRDHVVMGDGGFESWFLRYRTRVFSPRWLGSVRRSTWVLRFENLEDDLHAALRSAGVSDVEPLDRVNSTQRERTALGVDFRSVRARRRAARVFGPFMSEFGYEHPQEWAWHVPSWAHAEYAVGWRARTARTLGLRGSLSWARWSTG